MKAIMLSINPQQCRRIARKEQTIVVLKTYPKLKPPFKCYIYETFGKMCWVDIPIPKDQGGGEIRDKVRSGGKVVGEFVCHTICAILTHPDFLAGKPLFYTWGVKATSMTMDELEAHSSGKDCYGWDISDLKIYDTPRDLGEFKPYHRSCRYDDLGLAIPKCETCTVCNLKRPPQSWCYVEERKI
jgi:hypothetical protein